jgi:hypothetical protein
MSETATDAAPEIPVRRRRRGRLGVWQVVWALTVSTIVALALLSMSGLPLRLPDWGTDRIETAFNERLGPLRLRLGSTELLVGTDGRPRVQLRNVEILDGTGNSVAMLNELGAGLSPAALLRGRLEPDGVRLGGAQITIRRSAAGEISIAFGGPGTIGATPGIADAAEAIDTVFASGVLAGLGDIEARDVTFTLEDARSGRVWQATDGALLVANTPERLEITVESEVFNGTEELARVEFAYRSERASPAATLEVRFENAAAADIALQSPALAVLSLLDAPISGSMRLAVDREGDLDTLAATLDIGTGRFRPAPEAQPLSFESARAYVEYDPTTGRVAVSEVSARTPNLSLLADGHLLLGDLRAGWPDRVFGQFRISELEVATGGLFEAPLRFDHALADFRIVLDPFVLDLGHLVLEGERGRQTVSGRVAASPEGWRIALDVSSPEIAVRDALAFWPVPAGSGARGWVARNVTEGMVRNLEVGLRKAPGAPVETVLSFIFEDVAAQVMPQFPPIRNASGQASLGGGRFSLSVEDGAMTPDTGVAAALAGSAFVVPDTRQRPSTAEILVAAEGPLASLLRLLDSPPVRVLARSNRPEDLLAIDAMAEIRGDIRLPLKRGLLPEDVAYEVEGTLVEVASDAMVPGRALRAETLAVRVTPGEIDIAGAVTLDGIPVDARFLQPLGPAAGEGGEVTARIELSPETIAALGIALPSGAVTGAAQGMLSLRLGEETPTRFRLTSDLVGAALSLPQIGWSKGRASAGTFEAEGEVASGGVRVDRLVLDAPGLKATGRIEPGIEAGTSVARFDRVRAGAWLDAPVAITGRGAGRPPSISIEGGTINLARRPETGGGGQGGATPIRLALDRLRIADGLDLAPFRGELSAGAGLSGSFEARVNGGAPVRGTLVPAESGTAMRITATDGGAVMRDAGIFRNARGGDFELILVPEPGQGRFEGQLSIGRTRIANAPALASLLDAVSIVGLLDELSGSGILFETVDARFSLSPDRVVVRQGAAVGASLGISMDGVYEIASKRMEMQGVISPVYILNGIGQILTRPGEGLFGFAYRMTGQPDTMRIQVNPLSILTPGMFRDIFRRPVPAATQ